MQNQEQDEIDYALNVTDFPFFDDDIFLLDFWNEEEGLDYLLGISDADGTAPLDTSFVRTLNGEYWVKPKHQHIVNAFMRKRVKLEKIWKSGLHPQLNTPSYYINWAISKKHNISWLDYAIREGFYKPADIVDDQQTNIVVKPLSNKERDTLLIIIAALAKEAKVDISRTSKAGELIANLTQLLGVQVGATTIETHLKKIPQALANRAS